ncbi:MAG TPA: bacterioferritin [Terriglobia bacterium]|nr:bacterioferritin [Terriglobia bacterium]
MKGKPEVLDVLAKMLKEELGAISQYMVHAEMCENWGYKRLSQHTKKESIGEMKHAETLIERILFLEGTPNLNDMPKLKVGRDVIEQLQNDLDLEKNAVAEYNAAIATCREAGDQASADILQAILADEEGHVDFLDTQLNIIEAVGLQNYLAQQLEE